MNKMTRLFEAASLQPLVTVEMMRMFTIICDSHYRGDTLRMKALEKLMSINSANCSRILQSIGKRHSSKHRPGLGLVETIPDPDDVRAKRVFPTEKGVEFYAKLKAIMLSKAVIE